MEKELTPKQQTSEAIRQADNILVLTGQHPSVDQAAATIALTTILRKFNKKVSGVISDEVPAGAKFLPTKNLDKDLGGLRDFIMQVDLGNAEVDRLKYTIEGGKLNVHVSPYSGSFRPEDVGFAYGNYEYDLIIVLGVASYSRIDKLFVDNSSQLGNVPLVNIDFHRSNEQYGAINLIESSAASLGEILVALSESLQTGMIDKDIATTLLTGLMAATDRFTATHTTAKALTVAAQMMALGADQQQVVRGLYRGDGRDKDRDRRSDRPQSQSPRSNRDQRDARGDSQPAAEQRQAQPLPAPVPASRPASAPTPPQAPVQISRPTQSTAPATPPSAPVSSPKNSAESQSTVAILDAYPPPALQSTEPVDTSKWETEGPAVTDPDDIKPFASISDDFDIDLEVEPLINNSAPAKIPPPAKPANPTNNPIFADRLL